MVAQGGPTTAWIVEHVTLLAGNAHVTKGGKEMRVMSQTVTVTVSMPPVRRELEIPNQDVMIAILPTLVISVNTGEIIFLTKSIYMWIQYSP